MPRFLQRGSESFCKRAVDKVKKWASYLMVSTSLAVTPATNSGCTEPEQLEQRHLIEDTGIWIEPYHGEVLQDENGAYFMAERCIVKFNESVSVDAVEDMTIGLDGRVTGHIPQLNAFEIEISSLNVALRVLNNRSEVEFATRNYYFESEWDNDTYSELGQEPPQIEDLPNVNCIDKGVWWSRQIHLTNGLNLLESSGVELNPVTIAVIDIAFDLDDDEDDFDIPYHQEPDRPRAYPGYDFGENDYDVHQIISTEMNGTTLEIAHGSIVASFAAAINNEKRTNGIASAGDDNFWILPLKVSPSNEDAVEEMYSNLDWFGDDFRISAAFEYVVENADEFNIHVVNISMGAYPIIPAWLSALLPELENKVLTWNAINDLTEIGVIVVASAGNEDTNACTQLPSSYPEVISVGATALDENCNEERGDFSNYHPPFLEEYEETCITISAPGKDVLIFDENYNPHLSSGTSYSAPQVAGLVALMRSIDPDLAYDEVVRLLRDNADDVPLTNDPNPELRDQILKRINVERTIRAILPETEVTPEYECSTIFDSGSIFSATDFDGDIVVFNESNSIYHLNVQTGEGNHIPETEDCIVGGHPRISGNTVVFTCDCNGADICYYEIGSNSVEPILDIDARFVSHPDIYENVIIYPATFSDDTNGIRVYYINTDEFQEIALPAGYYESGVPKLNGSRIATGLSKRRQYEDTIFELWHYDIDTGQWNAIEDYPEDMAYGWPVFDIYGERIAYAHAYDRNLPGDISIYEIETGSTRLPLDEYGPHRGHSPALSEDRLFFNTWVDDQIFGINLTSLEVQELAEGDHLVSISASGDNVVFMSGVGQRFVHSCTLVSQ